MDETDIQIITQPAGETFRLGHAGELAHTTPHDRPLVHMLHWDDDTPHYVKGRVALTGDAEHPVDVRHVFGDTHHQSHVLKTALAEPVHHALQMRTPLQVRFCNSWHIASDYTVEVNLGRRQLLSLRLSGATVAKPQPCDDEAPCPPVVTAPLHP